MSTTSIELRHEDSFFQFIVHVLNALRGGHVYSLNLRPSEFFANSI